MIFQLWISQRASMSTLMAVSMASYSVYCLGLAIFVSTKLQIYLLIVFFGLAHVMYTNTSALLASLTPPQSLGLALGGLSGVKALASGLGPVLFAVLFSRMVAIKDAVLADHPRPIPYADDTAYCIVNGLHCTAVPFMLGCLIAWCAMVACMFLPVNMKVGSQYGAEEKAVAAGTTTKELGAPTPHHRFQASGTCLFQTKDLKLCFFWWY
jgi:MFS family permease